MASVVCLLWKVAEGARSRSGQVGGGSLLCCWLTTQVYHVKVLRGLVCLCGKRILFFSGSRGRGGFRGKFGVPAFHRKYRLQCLRLTLTVVLRVQGIQARLPVLMGSSAVRPLNPHVKTLLRFAQSQRLPTASEGGLRYACVSDCRYTPDCQSCGLQGEDLFRGLWGSTLGTLGYGNSIETSKHSLFYKGAQSFVPFGCFVGRSRSNLIFRSDAATLVAKCRPPVAASCSVVLRKHVVYGAVHMN